MDINKLVDLNSLRTAPILSDSEEKILLEELEINIFNADWITIGIMAPCDTKAIETLKSISKNYSAIKFDNLEMYFDDDSPCCFLEIKSIGSLNPSEMAKSISNFVFEKMGIPIDKIYISFEDVSASMWAWNGRTFG